MYRTDIDKTAFLMRQGLFWFTVMQFGAVWSEQDYLRVLLMSSIDLTFYDALFGMKQVWKHIRVVNPSLQNVA